MTYGGYAGKLLRVNLSTGVIEQQDTQDYLPDWYGGRAMAARIAWDEIPPDTAAFDPQSPLMILTGPLTGTAAPFREEQQSAVSHPRVILRSGTQDHHSADIGALS